MPRQFASRAPVTVDKTKTGARTKSAGGEVASGASERTEGLGPGGRAALAVEALNTHPTVAQGARGAQVAAGELEREAGEAKARWVEDSSQRLKLYATTVHYFGAAA